MQRHFSAILANFFILTPVLIAILSLTLITQFTHSHYFLFFACPIMSVFKQNCVYLH